MANVLVSKTNAERRKGSTPLIRIVTYKHNGGKFMGENNVTFDKCKVTFCDVETGEKNLELDTTSAPLFLDNSTDICRECIEDEVTGSTVVPINNDLNIAYLDACNNILATTAIMPDIINVQNPNKETVFVEFADGSKEVAHLNDGDVFNLETGILICIVKKILSDMDILCSGSSAYNKIIKYALTKVDAKKKAKEAEIEKYKAERRKVAQIKRDQRRLENKKREARIKEMAEAYKMAFNEISNSTLGETLEDIEKSETE